MKGKIVSSLIVILVIATIAQGFVVEPAKLNSAPYAIWAHYHWIWLNAHVQNQTNMLQLMHDYLDRDIPVGAINIDSGWSTCYNNFVVDTNKFPNATDFVNHAHSLNINVIMWATSVVNPDCPIFNEGKEKGYFLNQGEIVKWWHGKGALLDYTYPAAVEWWHNQMDKTIKTTGIDGWKIDGSDPLIFELIIPFSHQGVIGHRKYADLMYRDFFNYIRQVNGDHCLIMSRPVDSYKVGPLDIYLSFSPHDVMFSGWVGDQKGSYDGMQKALSNMIHSAWRNYTNFGSDLGGYLNDADAPFGLGRTREVFLRWAQLAAFCSLMENGGGGEHRAWIFDEYYKTGNETVNIYRMFAHLHTELAPFFLSAGTEAYAQKTSVMHPMANFTEFMPESFDYVLWNDIFVAPFTSNGTVRENIEFPGNASTHWVWWFDESVSFKGGDKVQRFECSLDKFPVFKRAGSIIPLQVSSHYTGHGDKRSKGFKTLLITHPHEYNKLVKKQVYEFKSSGYEVSYEMMASEGSEMHISVTAQDAPVMILVRGIQTISAEMHNNIQMAQAVQNNGEIEAALVPQALSYDMLMEQDNITSFHIEKVGENRANVWIRVPTGADQGIKLVMSNVKGAF